MLALLSPAKKQNFNQNTAQTTTPIPFPQETKTLVETLRQLEPDELSKLMSISNKLAELNFSRYLEFDVEHKHQSANPALFAFKGDVYQSFDAETLSEQAIQFAQNHIGILSGLYGLLRPLDAIQAHRLEMGTRLQTPGGSTLYQFWGDKITQLLNQRIAEDSIPAIINLASQEYSKAIQPKALNCPFITIDFKEHRDGKLKTIGIFAKRARGLMARYIAKQGINKPTDLQQFNEAGYQFSPNHSDPTHWVFIRNIQP